MRRGILATTEQLRFLQRRISQRPFDKIYDLLQKRCALILESAPITEQQWRIFWGQGRWSSAVRAARAAQGRILDLAIAYHIDSNTAYRSRAIEELKNLVSWTTWVDPCHNSLPVDLCTAEAATAVVIGLDWLWDDLTEAERLRALQALRQKAIEPYLQAVKDNVWWYSCYHNWNAVINSGCGLAALALGDDDPQAQEAYEVALGGLNHFFDALGREGGWDEGTGYWGYAIRYVLILAEAAEHLTDDQRIFHKRGLSATGLFPIYFSPNGRPAGFGDASTIPTHGMMYSLVSRYGLRELAWWLDTYTFDHDITTTGWSQAGLALLMRPTDADVPDKPDLSPVKVFNEIGWAAMADQWPRPTFYVSAKTGDLSANHSQRDMNSIQLQVDGEMMLTDPPSPPNGAEYFSDARQDFYEVQARGHNTIVVADSDHQIDAQGQIIEAQCGDRYRWVACDSKGACGENTHFIRHIVMLLDESGVGKSLVVLDDVTNGAPETVVLYWHTLGVIKAKTAAMKGTITGRRANLHFAIAATVGASLKSTRQKLHTGATDRILRVSAGVMGRAFFVSVFSREDPGHVQIDEGESGESALRVITAGAELDFGPVHHGLTLRSVSMTE